MPRVSKKEEPKKEEKKVEKKSTSVKKEEFVFKPINIKEEPKVMSKEDRRAMIDELVGTPKVESKRLEYTVEETEYTPKEWIVCVNTNGYIFQEPVPRYCDYKSFVYLMAGLPDKPIFNTRTVSFEADYYLTRFEVKDIDCHIVSSSYNGFRTPNPYAQVFNILNGTVHVGGNIVFAGHEKGFTKSEAKEVVKSIIKVFNTVEL